MSKYPKPSSWGYVYVIKSSSGLCKIGLTSDVHRRLAELRRDYPSESLVVARVIETDNMMWTERQLHSLFSRRHVHGEWFALMESDFDWIDLIERDIKRYLDLFREG